MSNEVDASRIQRRGLMLVLSSPSGAGKTTLSRQLLDNDKQIQLSVSATTRARRSGEKDGVDYHFVDTATFSGMVERGEFLEHARVFDHFYGTPIGARGSGADGRAATCCSTSTGRARSSSRKRPAATW